MLLDQIFRGASPSAGKLIAQFCQREGVTEEAFRFGLIGLYGRNREAPCWDGAVETIDGALCRLELPELAAVLVGPETDCRTEAERIVGWMEERGTAVQAAYLSGRRLTEARRLRTMLEAAADGAFYAQAPGCRPLEELLAVPREPVLSADDMGRLGQLRREIASCLTRGEAACVERKLESYDAICAQGRPAAYREQYASLYCYVSEELAAPDRELSRYHQQLRPEGKSVFQAVMEANSAGQVRAYLAWYADRLLAWYHPLKENTAHRVTAYVEEYVGKHYMETVSIEEIAAQVGLSPNYVRCVFKNTRGVTIQNYLSDYRLRMACKLLRNTAVKVSRVGQMVGYSNVSYFCAAFQKRFGKTPSEWQAGRCGEDTYLRP